MQLETTLGCLILSIVLGGVDGSYEWSPWSRPSPCSVSCGQGIISRIRECKPMHEDSVEEDDRDCQGPATIEEACFMSPCQSGGSVPSNCNCGCKLTATNGQIVSKLFKSESLCTWSIHAKPGSSIELSINRIKNFDWKSGGLYIAGKEKVHKYTEQKGHRGQVVHQLPITIRSKGNSINLTMHYSKLGNISKFVEMEASYTISYDHTAIENNLGSKPKEDKQIFGGLNLPAVAGIAACALIIILASIIIACRKFRNSGSTEKNEEIPEEGLEDNCSSLSGSNRSSGRQNKSNGKGVYSTPFSTGTLSMEERDRLLTPARHPSTGNEMYLQKEGSIISSIPTTGYLPSGQAYVNWPVQHGQIVQPVQLQQMMPTQSPVTIQQLPQPAIDYMIRQAQLNYQRQMSYEQSNAGSYEYATSGPEG